MSTVHAAITEFMIRVAALNWVYENIEAFGGDPENITVFGQSAGGASVRALVSSPLTGNKINRAIIQSGIFPSSGFDCSKPEDVMPYGIEFAERTGAGSLEELRELPWERLVELYWEILPGKAGGTHGMVSSCGRRYFARGHGRRASETGTY